MATGHVLWIAQGKKKKVVYDFIEHVGMDWMRHVDAVALGYRLIQTRFDGIVAHGKFQIANGRMEGLNQKIKTMLRHAYGIADDEYLFLKIMDLSRAPYVRNPKSHKVLH